MCDIHIYILESMFREQKIIARPYSISTTILHQRLRKKYLFGLFFKVSDWLEDM